MTVTPPTRQTPGICWDCGGPCLSFKGTNHGWRCRLCVEAYLEAAAIKAVVAETKLRTKRLTKLRAELDAHAQATRR